MKVRILPISNFSSNVGVSIASETIDSELSVGIGSKISEVIEFLENHKPIITKPLRVPYFLYSEEHSFAMYTSLIESVDQIACVGNFTLPSIVQPLIRKKYEIRSFFLDGEFYSAAIFSSLIISKSFKK